MSVPARARRAIEAGGRDEDELRRLLREVETTSVPMGKERVCLARRAAFYLDDMDSKLRPAPELLKPLA